MYIAEHRLNLEGGGGSHGVVMAKEHWGTVYFFLFDRLIFLHFCIVG